MEQTVIQLTVDESNSLRDALRDERLATEALEIAQLTARTTLHHAISRRAALLDTLADKYGFDSSDPHSFNCADHTLVKKKG